MSLIKPWCKHAAMVACSVPVAQQGLERVQLRPSALPNITVRSVIQRSSNLWVCMVSFRHCGDRRTPISLKTFHREPNAPNSQYDSQNKLNAPPCPGLSPAQILLCQSWNGWERRPLVIIEFGLEFSVTLPSLKYTVHGARRGWQGSRLISELTTKIRHFTNKRLT